MHRLVTRGANILAKKIFDYGTSLEGRVRPDRTFREDLTAFLTAYHWWGAMERDFEEWILEGGIPNYQAMIALAYDFGIEVEAWSVQEPANSPYRE